MSFWRTLNRCSSNLNAQLLWGFTEDEEYWTHVMHLLLINPFKSLQLLCSTLHPKAVLMLSCNHFYCFTEQPDWICESRSVATWLRSIIMQLSFSVGMRSNTKEDQSSEKASLLSMTDVHHPVWVSRVRPPSASSLSSGQTRGWNMS